jgi:hypothetical protein
MKASIEFEMGERTCAIEPGKFCRWLAAKRFGTIPVCLLFRDRDGDEFGLLAKDGWTQRCPPCLDQFPPPVKDELA